MTVCSINFPRLSLRKKLQEMRNVRVKDERHRVQKATDHSCAICLVWPLIVTWHGNHSPSVELCALNLPMSKRPVPSRATGIENTRKGESGGVHSYMVWRQNCSQWVQFWFSSITHEKLSSIKIG